MAYRPSLINARITKIVPNRTNCTVTDPAEGDMNCGKKAKKKRAVLGFIISMSADSQKILHAVLQALLCFSEAVRSVVENNVLHPK
jgi:hypothetical protein